MTDGRRLVFPAGFGRRRTPREQLLLVLAAVFAALAIGLVATAGWHGAFSEVQALSRPLPPLFWESLTSFGDERMVLALALPFCVRYPRLLWGIVIASLLGALLSRGLKVWFDFPRPPAVLPPEAINIIGRRVTTHSFPSGHTISAFTFVGVWLAMCPCRRVLPWLAAAALVGVSRVAVGAHWPIDVLTGAVVGLLAAWLALPLLPRLVPRLQGRPTALLFGVVVLAIATLPFDGQGYPGSLAVRLLMTAGSLGLAWRLWRAAPDVRPARALAGQPMAQRVSPLD